MSRKRLTIIIIILAALVSGCVYVSVRSAAVGGCLPGMVYIPEGRFVTGVDMKQVEYLMDVCSESIGSCYKSWFMRETPRHIVKHRAFCIDKYEFPNVQGAAPQQANGWKSAEKQCEARGKRLCAEYEWERACLSTWEYNWSFGDKYEDGACNIYTGEVEETGMRPECRSFENVMDLNGNMSEWVYDSAPPGEGKKTKIVKGGSYRDHPIFTRCTYKDYRDMRDEAAEIGFRCCSSPK